MLYSHQWEAMIVTLAQIKQGNVYLTDRIKGNEQKKTIAKTPLYLWAKFKAI